MPNRYPISVQLVTRNGARWLPYCLDSLLKQTRQDFFLMLIDNDSADETRLLSERLVAGHPSLSERTRFVGHRQNLGFARAHNQAYLWTDSDFVLVLNQDVVLAPGYLELTARCLEQHEQVAAVTGKLLRWEFASATFHPDQRTWQGGEVDTCGLRVWRSRRVTNLGHGELNDGRFERELKVFGVPATAALYRRSALEAVSPTHECFDPLFGSYKEDVDLAWRLDLAGYDAWCVPQAIGYHDRAVAGGPADGHLVLAGKHYRFHPEFQLASWVNHLATLVKHESLRSLAPDLPWVLWHELQKLGFLLVTSPVILLRGLWRLFARLPYLLAERRSLRGSRRIAPLALRKFFR